MTSTTLVCHNMHILHSHATLLTCTYYNRSSYYCGRCCLFFCLFFLRDKLFCYNIIANEQLINVNIITGITLCTWLRIHVHYMTMYCSVTLGFVRDCLNPCMKMKWQTVTEKCNCCLIGIWVACHCRCIIYYNLCNLLVIVLESDEVWSTVNLHNFSINRSFIHHCPPISVSTQARNTLNKHNATIFSWSYWWQELIFPFWVYIR